MFFDSRITGKRLSDFCHRLAISAESGIDVRRTWRREADTARGRVKAELAGVAQSLETGDSLTDALKRTGPIFPSLFLEMTEVGEQTGTLPATMHRLSRHYRRQHEMAREVRARLRWPMIELVMAAFIIGVLLGVLGMLDARRLNGQPIDVLGLGVTGSAALALYIQVLVAVGLAISLAVVAFRRGMLWTRTIQHAAMRVPALGPALEKLCMARLAWALHLLLNVQMDLRRLIPLALRATGSSYYTSRTTSITESIAAGMPMHQAFADTGVFPTHFLEALYVAEESGQIVESMSRLSQQYEAEADDALSTLSTIFSFAVWGVIAIGIGALILRMFKTLYLDTLHDALNF